MTSCVQELVYTGAWAGSYLVAHVCFIGFSIWAAKREKEKLTAWSQVAKKSSEVQTAFLLSGDDYRVADQAQTKVDPMSVKSTGGDTKSDEQHVL